MEELYLFPWKWKLFTCYYNQCKKIVVKLLPCYTSYVWGCKVSTQFRIRISALAYFHTNSSRESSLITSWCKRLPIVLEIFLSLPGMCVSEGMLYAVQGHGTVSSKGHTAQDTDTHIWVLPTHDFALIYHHRNNWYNLEVDHSYLVNTLPILKAQILAPLTHRHT